MKIDDGGREFERDHWIDCPTCQNIIQDDECVLCGDDADPEQYATTAEWSNHWLGPFCSAECREKAEVD